MAREKRFQTTANQWGSGRVHRYFYDSLNKRWYVPCASTSRQPYGRVIDDSRAEITCKLCLTNRFARS